MKNSRKKAQGHMTESNMRLNPESRLCPRFDSMGIAMFPVADKKEMGVRIVDNFCEEHIM